MAKHRNGSVTSAPLRRREFLLFGAAGAFGLWAEPLISASEPVPAVAPTVLDLPPAPLSVGFVEGSEFMPDVKGHAWSALRSGLHPAEMEPRSRVRVVPAREVPIGDQMLASTTIEVKIHGLYPRTPIGRFDAADLDVYFPSPDPASPDPIPFHAWSFRRRPAPSASPPVRFVLPLEIDGGLELALTVTALRPRGPAERRTYFTRFTVDWQEDRPKLQRGMYLLGLSPAWEAERTLPGPGERFQMDLLSIAIGIEPVILEE